MIPKAAKKSTSGRVRPQATETGGRPGDVWGCRQANESARASPGAPRREAEIRPQKRSMQRRRKTRTPRAGRGGQTARDSRIGSRQLQRRVGPPTLLPLSALRANGRGGRARGAGRARARRAGAARRPARPLRCRRRACSSAEGPGLRSLLLLPRLPLPAGLVSRCRWDPRHRPPRAR